MSNFKKFILIILLIALIVISFFPIHMLVLEDIQSNKIIFSHRVNVQDTFTISWMHSVELAPWEEVFFIDENYNIILNYTRFKAFGAGVPKEAGKRTEIRDGWIYFLDINKPMPNLCYGISNFAKHRFSYKNKELNLYDLVPNDYPIKIYSIKTSIIGQLLNAF